jgi:transcriptional regulator with XRE-family HTH domain
MGTKPRSKPKYLGDKLRRIRLSFGLTQTELLHRLGVEDLIEYHHISRYESGTREPSLVILLRYARVAGVHTEVLIDDELDLPDKLPGSTKHEEIKRKFASRRKRR